MTNSRQRALLLVNRNARAAGTVLNDTIALLNEGGIDVREEPCPAPDRLAEVIQQQSGALDCVIIGGGDGTLNG